MVYELLWDCFVHDDFASGFDLFLEICEHITCGHVLPSVSHLLVALQLLALEKQIKGIRSITIGEVIYRLIIRTLAI
jgi:hypothetical protein